MKTKTIGVVLLMVLGALGLRWGVAAEPPIVAALTLLWVIALLWLTELVHITITGLLVPVLAVALGLLDVVGALENFANPIIFVFLGGFALAAAMRIQGLDTWLADIILGFTGGRLDRAVVLLSLATALLSMWINNTAVTAMMLPLALGLLAEKPDLNWRAQAFTLLGIAYAASIGGVGTLIGSAPNGIVAAEIGITFVEWLYIGIPLVVVLWPAMIAVLYLVLRPDFQGCLVDIRGHDFVWTVQRKLLLGIFALAVAGWLFGRPLGAWLGIADNMDALVAISAMILIALAGVARWQDMEKSTDWGVLLLFGGGLTLGAVLKASGASQYLGLALAGLVGDWSTVFIVLALVAFVVFFSEFASNTATAALLIPVFVALPGNLLDPSQAALAIGIAASTAFMLPVGTPPNAMVHGTGKVNQKTMIRAGFVLNLVSIGVLTVAFGLFY